VSTLTLYQQSPDTGLVATFVSCTSGGDKYQQDGNVVLHVVNGDIADHTVTIVSHAHPTAGETTADHTETVTAGTRRLIGPLSASVFTDPSDGLAHITYSAVTSMTIAAVRNAPTQN